MRRLAQELSVVPMALYKHVANKDELLDGMVDIVFGEIECPSIDDDWRTAMQRRAISPRDQSRIAAMSSSDRTLRASSPSFDPLRISSTILATSASTWVSACSLALSAVARIAAERSAISFDGFFGAGRAVAT